MENAVSCNVEVHVAYSFIVLCKVTLLSINSFAYGSGRPEPYGLATGHHKQRSFNLCHSTVDVFQLSYLHDPEADDFQNLTNSSLSHDAVLVKFQ